jgi:flagella basal body P-ring formation protein FlgA
MGFFIAGKLSMNASCALRRLLFPLSVLLAAPAFSASLAAQLEQAARAQAERQLEASGLTEPEIDLALASSRPAPPCAQPLEIEPLDTRQLARMRFAVRCPGERPWTVEFVVRARVSARVAVTSVPVAAGEPLSDAMVALERREVSSIPDALGSIDAVAGQSSRRSLRPGEVLRAGQLAAPVLVKRGDQVLMLARRDQVEVSTSGEALDSGSRGQLVRVRNGTSGQVVRMRVTGAGTVEPVGQARLTP